MVCQKRRRQKANSDYGAIAAAQSYELEVTEKPDCGSRQRSSKSEHRLPVPLSYLVLSGNHRIESPLEPTPELHVSNVEVDEEHAAPSTQPEQPTEFISSAASPSPSLPVFSAALVPTKSRVRIDFV